MHVVIVSIPSVRNFGFFMLLMHSVVCLSQNGHIGINTGTPVAALHVADSSVLFTAGAYDGSAIPPVSGSGSRMMWFSSKRAFRVGTAVDDSWDEYKLGNASFASGVGNAALSVGTAAFGQNTHAQGVYSIALGYQTKSLFSYSVASGYQTEARADYSFAAGIGCITYGMGAMAMGYYTIADRAYTFATGYRTLAHLDRSSAFGFQTKASAYQAAAFGYETRARAVSSFVIGAFNDSASYSFNLWEPDEPIFIVGNGTSHSTRHNALTLLKNGNLGLDTRTPSFRLHVTNSNPEDGGYQEGIMIENIHSTPGEAALSFRNTSMPAGKQWITGINETPLLAFAYGATFTSTNTKMVLDTMGRMGINTLTPQAQLHVVRSGPSGGPFHSNAIAIFESNSNSYIQLSSENTDEAGILSGNQLTTIRSGIVFRADSVVHIRAGGNNTRISIIKNGNVGIGLGSTNPPLTKLHVNGTVQLGVNGTTFNEIIKASVVADLPSVAAGATHAQTYTVDDAAVNSVVAVSHDVTFNDGFVIASARVSASNTVEVRFVNTSASSYNPPSMEYHFMIIR